MSSETMMWARDAPIGFAVPRRPVERDLVHARDRPFKRVVRVGERLAWEFDCHHVISGSRRPALYVPWTTDVRIVLDV